MGYKAPAKHRGDAYHTDCDCKYHYFPEMRAARLHCDHCEKATKVIYKAAYSDAMTVYEKGADAP
jgi:hypothetical protein